MLLYKTPVAVTRYCIRLVRCWKLWQAWWGRWDLILIHLGKIQMETVWIKTMTLITILCAFESWVNWKRWNTMVVFVHFASATGMLATAKLYPWPNIICYKMNDQKQTVFIFVLSFVKQCSEILRKRAVLKGSPSHLWWCKLGCNAGWAWQVYWTGYC